MNFPRGTVQDYTIHSDKLGEPMDLLIYLPPTFSPLYKYNVLIALDGLDYFQLGGIVKLADEMLHQNVIEQLIIVGVPYKNGRDRHEKYHPDGEQSQAFLQFLVQELVPYLDRTFPTYQIGMGRALIGDSLAGYTAFKAALTYPHTFGKVALQSPYAHINLFSTIEQFSHPALLEIYHVVGTEEISVKTNHGKIENFIEQNRKLAAILASKGFQYHYQEFNGSHTWKYWQQDLRRALPSLFSPKT
ncbi:alpha/beta hydrolase [Bacillus marasmi]|uniref:alpha/beta hydrolase n=1 Tax=Bacillus marasmi TaxID=1926279 RepID=UPI0011CC3844|nr:alpha/beta hydrolase-fold protein [Bacillus marasmi]